MVVYFPNDIGRDLNANAEVNFGYNANSQSLANHPVDPYTGNRVISDSEWQRLHKRVRTLELRVFASAAGGFVDPGDA